MTRTVTFPQLGSKVRAELRASHAGETGAVWIYRGILLVNWFRGDKQIGDFARHHLETERQHLQDFESIIHWFRGSFILPLWIAAGFLTGALPALFGRDWVYFTIFKVESFVDKHYQQQIAMLGSIDVPRKQELLELMTACNEDEQAHRDEALAAMKTELTALMRLWGTMVEKGSGIAVAFARII